jgi:hypothetical protein
MKITNPLLSQEAYGTLGDVLTFSKKKVGQLARYQRKQRDVLTISREKQRQKFQNASFGCRFFEYGEAIFGVALFGNEKSLYLEEAKKQGLTPYNVCIKEYLCQKLEV